MFYQRLISLCMVTLLGAWGTSCTLNNCEEGAICLGDGEELQQCVSICQRLVECGQITIAQRGDCLESCQHQLHNNHDSLDEYCECASDVSCRDVRVCGRPPFAIPPARSGDDVVPPPSPDAGPPDLHVDAGYRTDASVDAGRSVDAGVDAGRRVDAGTDAGALPDASRPDTGADAAPHADAGPSSDAGDAGPAPHTDAASGACTCDEDCAASEGCVEGICRARCTASCQCRRGDVCETGFCVTPAPVSMSCQNDCECPSGQHCVASVCTLPMTLPPVL